MKAVVVEKQGSTYTLLASSRQLVSMKSNLKITVEGSGIYKAEEGSWVTMYHDFSSWLFGNAYQGQTPYLTWLLRPHK